ncbi:MAG: hypothetical protein V1821_02270 [bacterium]
MTLRQYIFLMLLGTALALGALGLVIFMTSPEEAGTVVLIVFYALIFFGTLGATTLIGLLVRFLFNRERQSTPVKVEISFRQGVLLAALLTSTLLFQSQHILNWWNALLLTGAVCTVETVFLKLNSRY